MEQMCHSDLKEQMSIFNWFTNKQPAKMVSAPESSGLGHIDATVPLVPHDRLRVKIAPPSVSHAANRKTERLERRELLYSVVRDAMIRVGLLASSYKFKVLSLDARGLQYLIMMDLTNQTEVDTSRLAEIEAMIAQTAKMRHDILVTSVYWRVSEHVTAGLPSSQTASVTQPTRKAPVLQAASRQPAIRVPLVSQPPPYEPLQANEVVAFKRALASATPVMPLSASGQIVTSGRRNPTPPEEFEDTQLADSDERASPLSGTQYGDLN